MACKISGLKLVTRVWKSVTPSFERDMNILQIAADDIVGKKPLRVSGD